MESKEKVTKEAKALKEGVYLSNFVAMGISLFVLVLAFAAGFFAKAYFGVTAPGSKTGAVVDTTGAQPTKTAVTLDQVKDVFNKAHIKFGDAKKKVIFVEASDPSCPYCSIASGQNGPLNISAGDRFKLVADGGTYEAPVVEMKKLVDQKKASFALIYRNGHGAGEMGMKALYCAFDQGKFWEAEELIMSATGYDLLNNTVKNDKGKTNELVAFLAPAVDQNSLRTCLESGKYDGRLAEDTKLGDSLGIGGTPGFFVNATAYAGAYSFADMRSTVESFFK